MLKLLSSLVSVILAFGLSGAARAEIFEYSNHVYGIDSSACRDHASSLAQKVAEATGGSTKSAYCVPLTGGGYDARVLTEVALKLELELAVFGFRVIHYPDIDGPLNKRYSVVSDDGSFYTVADCLKVLDAYATRFESLTGLRPVSSQCSQLTPHQYIPQVDAFGVGRQHLFELDIGLGSAASSEAGQLDVMNYLSSLGASPIMSGRPGSYLKIKYFFTHEIFLNAFNFSHKNNFINEAECLDATKLVQGILGQRSDNKLVSLKCGRGDLSRFPDSAAMVAILDLTASGEGFLRSLVRTYDQFGTYQECRQKVADRANSYCAADIDIHGNFHGYSLNVIEQPQ